MQLNAQQYATVVQGLRDAAISAGSDQRKVSRMAVQARVNAASVADGVAMARFTALTQDVSMTGMALLQSVPVMPGSQMAVELPDGAGRGKGLVLLAVAVHCRPLVNGIFSVGLSFVGPAIPGIMQAAPERSNPEQSRIRKSILD